MSEKEKQDSLFFKQRYVTDWGISLFNLIKKVGKFPLLKTYSFSDVISSKQFKKSSPLIGVIFIFVVILLIIWKIPQFQVPNSSSISEKERITLEDKARGTLIQGIGGLFFFVTAYLTWKNLELADSKQITERFSKAVEQLGEESITVRLGAIYSLERIAKDSKYDHWTIMEVLSAFIREKSHDNREADSEIPQDIQTALTVIGRRNTENDPENGEIDLRGANLNGVNLNGAKLDKVNFNNAKLNKAQFIQASLNKVNFLSADLNNTNFLEANLDNANFFNTNLDNAGFVKANFTRAYFSLANLTEAKFHEANLRSTDFSQATLTKTKFEKATLIESIFDGADFYQTKFNEANIEGASFINIKESHITAYIENLTINQILEAKNWDKAKYNPDFWDQLKPYLTTKNE